MAAARRLYIDGPPADGLVRRSRRHRARLAVALWFASTRGAADYTTPGLVRSDLTIAAAPVPLLADEGMSRMLAVGNALDITVVPPAVDPPRFAWPQPGQPATMRSSTSNVFRLDYNVEPTAC